MLYARPKRARHVRSLTVCPDPPAHNGRTPRWGRIALPDAYAVSSAVRRAARHFEVLRYFAWHGEELPPYDDMWFALRILSVALHLHLSVVISRLTHRFFVFPFSFRCRFFSVQLPAAQVHLDHARVHPTLIEQSCVCFVILHHLETGGLLQASVADPPVPSYLISASSRGSR